MVELWVSCLCVCVCGCVSKFNCLSVLPGVSGQPEGCAGWVAEEVVEDKEDLTQYGFGTLVGCCHHITTLPSHHYSPTTKEQRSVLVFTEEVLLHWEKSRVEWSRAIFSVGSCYAQAFLGMPATDALCSGR